MSLDLMPGGAAVFSNMMVHSMVSVQVVVNMMAVPLDPPDIVTKRADGFSIDMNNMEPLMPYMMTFEDSKYVLWKNENGALVIREI